MVEARKRNHDPPRKVVHLVYRDHVMFTQSDPVLLKPAIRESIGWLVYECESYVIITWDRNAEPPTLKGGDSKASGLVLLRSDILEMDTIA